MSRFDAVMDGPRKYDGLCANEKTERSNLQAMMRRTIKSRWCNSAGWIHAVTLIVALWRTTPLFAQSNFASTGYAQGAAAYLSVPAYAYSASLCGAVTAWKTDLGGLQYNPAILDAVPSFYFSGSYAMLSLDRSFMAADGAMPLGSYLSLDVSFVRAGVGNIERRDDFGNTDSISASFSDQNNALAVAIAGRLPWNVSVGVRVRGFFEGLDNERGYGMGADAGATWQPVPYLCVGASALNLGSYLWWTTGHVDQVLPQGRLGVAGLFFSKQLIAELDLIKTYQEPEDVSIAMQYTLFNIFSFRGAMATSTEILKGTYRDPDFSLGMGFRYSFLGFDYSLTIPSDNPLGLTNQVSLILQIHAD